MSVRPSTSRCGDLASAWCRSPQPRSVFEIRGQLLEDPFLLPHGLDAYFFPGFRELHDIDVLHSCIAGPELEATASR